MPDNPFQRNQLTLRDTERLAVGWVEPAFFNMEQRVYARRYPEFNYGVMVPVVTEGAEWARGTMFRSSDMVGKAEWWSAKANDMPYADVTRDQFLHSFHMAAIGFEWNLEEVAVAAMEGRDIGDEKAVAARRLAERFNYGVALIGHTEKGVTGALNDPTVPRADASNVGTQNGATASTFWVNKTEDQILADVNGAIMTGYSSSFETEISDTVLLPTEAYHILATRRISGTTDTVLAYLQSNNTYTIETGGSLLIRGLRFLRNAGVGGVGRMVTYRRDPEVLRYHYPMPHRFLPPFQKSSTTWEVAGIMRTGGTEVRLPLAMRYTDGVTPAP